MVEYTRREVLAAAGAAAIALKVGTPASAAERKSVRIGYVVSKTGMNATGAGTATIPNYELWADDVKKAGGLAMPDGTRLPLEIIAYDDRSETEEVVRGVERLARQDKVDFILSPWGTAFNLAVAPLMDRFGYPQLVGTSLIPEEIDVASKWKGCFWFLGATGDYARGFASLIDAAGSTTNRQVAVLSVADGFGIEYAKAIREVFQEEGIEIVMDKSYPIGTQDFSALMNSAASSGADIFMALSYPPDSFALAKQARLTSYNPKIFYTGVGTSFPFYPAIIEGREEGVMSLGGVDNSLPEMQAYIKRHTELLKQGPDFWASSMIYSSLQILQQAIERKGLDREAVTQEIATGTFDTITGPMQMQNNRLTDMWQVGQWQNGAFVGVEPAKKPGAIPAILPKPAWT